MVETGGDKVFDGATGAATGFDGGEVSETTVEGPVDTVSTLGAFGLTEENAGETEQVKGIQTEDGITTRGMESMGLIEIGFSTDLPRLEDDGGRLGTFLEPLWLKRVRTMSAADKS